MSSDVENLLIRCDSLLSLIRHRERFGLSEQTIRDLDELIPKLRRETDAIIKTQRTAEGLTDHAVVQELIGPPDWAGPFTRRCHAVLEKRGEQPYYGRCELKPHTEGYDHALERGMVWVRWNSTVVWEQPHYE